jgi:phosphopantothenate-cysteine ligase
MTSQPKPNGNGKTSSPEIDYFAANPEPASLDQTASLARDFINHHASKNRRVALVTSGGTTVPLENQTVRFIDNFSAGTRGATSAEYFLENDYAVIFLHRQFSLLPYSRHYSHSTNCFLDFMTSNASGEVVVDPTYQSQMSAVLQRYERAKRENALLLLPFTTVNEYLWDLRALATLMQPLGANGLFYLAAAVSDFFVPTQRMVEHKIQSSEDFTHANGKLASSSSPDNSNGEHSTTPAAHMAGKSLIIDLDPVPKFLKQLVDAWAPRSMIVSFKLETDEALLAEKSHYALKKYAHHLVIGNLLNTRKYEVLFVSAMEGEQWIRVPVGRRAKSVTSPRGEDGVESVGSREASVEIESLIVPEVARMHSELIAKGSS